MARGEKKKKDIAPLPQQQLRTRLSKMNKRIPSCASTLPLYFLRVNKTLRNLYVGLLPNFV